MGENKKPGGVGHRTFKLGAELGFEPSVSRGKEGQKAQWDAQNVAKLLKVVSAWPTLRPELQAAVLAIVESAKGSDTP